MGFGGGEGGHGESRNWIVSFGSRSRRCGIGGGSNYYLEDLSTLQVYQVLSRNRFMVLGLQWFMSDLENMLKISPLALKPYYGPLYPKPQTPKQTEHPETTPKPRSRSPETPKPRNHPETPKPRNPESPETPKPRSPETPKPKTLRPETLNPRC